MLFSSFMKDTKQVNPDDSKKTDGSFTVSVASMMYPFFSFIFRLLRTIFNRLAVIVLFGSVGLVVGAVIGLPSGPGIAITAAVGGAFGLLTGGWWEFRRLENGIEYDDLLD